MGASRVTDARRITRSAGLSRPFGRRLCSAARCCASRGLHGLSDLIFLHRRTAHRPAGATLHRLRAGLHEDWGELRGSVSTEQPLFCRARSTQQKGDPRPSSLRYSLFLICFPTPRQQTRAVRGCCTTCHLACARASRCAFLLLCFVQPFDSSFCAVCDRVSARAVAVDVAAKLFWCALVIVQAWSSELERTRGVRLSAPGNRDGADTKGNTAGNSGSNVNDDSRAKEMKAMEVSGPGRARGERACVPSSSCTPSTIALPTTAITAASLLLPTPSPSGLLPLTSPSPSTASSFPTATFSQALPLSSPSPSPPPGGRDSGSPPSGGGGGSTFMLTSLINFVQLFGLLAPDAAGLVDLFGIDVLRRFIASSSAPPKALERPRRIREHGKENRTQGSNSMPTVLNSHHRTALPLVACSGRVLAHRLPARTFLHLACSRVLPMVSGGELGGPCLFAGSIHGTTRLSLFRLSHFPSLLAASCTYPLTYTGRLVMQLAMPLAWWVAFALVFGFVNAIAAYRRRRLPACLPLPASFGDLFTRGLSADHFVFGLLAVSASSYLPGLLAGRSRPAELVSWWCFLWCAACAVTKMFLSASLQPHSCLPPFLLATIPSPHAVTYALVRPFAWVTVGPYTFLADDVSVQVMPAADPAYAALSTWASPLSVAWIVGVPSLMLGALVAARAWRREDDMGPPLSVCQRRALFWVRPLCSNARPRAFWWDVFSQLRRVVLMDAVINGLVGRWIAWVLCFVFFVLQVCTRGYACAHACTRVCSLEIAQRNDTLEQEWYWV